VVPAQDLLTVPEPLDPLSCLAIRHGTDKWGVHGYTPTYHRLFGHLRDRPVRLLEIGVGGYTMPMTGGASLRMWAEYFPRGHVVGLDITPKRLHLGPRVSLETGSQSDPAVLRRVWDRHGPFDIIIDDGSHVVTDVLESFRALYPLLAEGATYVVEDIQTAFWERFGGNPGARGTVVSLVHDVVLAMHHREVSALGGTPLVTEFGDLTAEVQVHRNLAVFVRGPNVAPSSAAPCPGDPALQLTRARLDHERARAPSAGGFVVAAMLEGREGRQAEALDLVQAGLARFPDDVALLDLGARLSERLGQMELCGSLLRRLQLVSLEGG
jgi:hypothetical protein